VSELLNEAEMEKEVDSHQNQLTGDLADQKREDFFDF